MVGMMLEVKNYELYKMMEDEEELLEWAGEAMDECVREGKERDVEMEQGVEGREEKMRLFKGALDALWQVKEGRKKQKMKGDSERERGLAWRGAEMKGRDSGEVGGKGKGKKKEGVTGGERRGSPIAAKAAPQALRQQLPVAREGDVSRATGQTEVSAVGGKTSEAASGSGYRQNRKGEVSAGEVGKGGKGERDEG